jgi:hypothetical protein
LETKHDRRKSPRTKLFVSTRRLQTKKFHNPEKLSWVRVSVKIVSVARKLSTIEERRKEQNCFLGEEITGTKVTNPKTLLGSSLGEDVRFRDDYDINFYD